MTGIIGRVISGGQTGVDRAALDAALALGIPVGGWCPKGRRAEDGRIPDYYPLVELETADYRVRTARNVQAAGMTIILIQRESDLSGGTAYTARLAREAVARGTSELTVADVTNLNSVRCCREHLAEATAAGVSILNIAGPRESKSPGIYQKALAWLMAVLGDGR